MAKMFYTLPESAEILGSTEDEVKQLASSGRLREFRDGPRLMLKADQVEQLRQELETNQGPSSSGLSGSMGQSYRRPILVRGKGTDRDRNLSLLQYPAPAVFHFSGLSFLLGACFGVVLVVVLFMFGIIKLH